MRFAIGDAVRTLARPNGVAGGHTRLPRYLRGKCGRIVAVRGAFPLADLRARGVAAEPETLYTVAFAASDVWDEPVATNDAVHADLWESYLVAR